MMVTAVVASGFVARASASGEADSPLLARVGVAESDPL